MRLFHASTHAPLQDEELEAQLNGEPLSDADDDRQWLVDENAEVVEDYIDVDDADKAFFKLWNAHVIPVYDLL